MHRTDDDLVATVNELVEQTRPDERQPVLALLDRLRAGDLRVALVGEAKRGKSTLGNALVGAAVLPSGVVPVTAVSTEIHAGSPRRARVTFVDGTSRTIPVAEVDRYVPERHNANNALAVASVRIDLPDGVPHPRLVLVDTPGTGSVHVHNTEQARTAFATMDAAIFVLTADPPISATELALLREVAGLAVQVFVVLNKADQLEAADVDEAKTFVTDVVEGALEARPQLWVCSARDGLRARCVGDRAEWEASGVSALSASLLTHLVEHREQDLRSSIAATAARLAASQLDGVTVTLASAEALGAERADRVREFTTRLQQVEQERAEAVDFVAAVLARERRALDVDAAAEVAAISTTVRERLESLLTPTNRVSAHDLEEQGRGVIGEVTRGQVERWSARWRARQDDAIADLVRRAQTLLDEAAGDLHAAVSELLGVRLRSEVPALNPPRRTGIHYDFDPDIGWNHALVAGLRTHVPARIARRRVSDYLRDEAGRLVDRHVGRSRADLQAWFEEAARTLSSQVTQAFTDLTASLEGGYRAALQLRQSAEPEYQRELVRLTGQKDALVELVGRLREVRAGRGRPAPRGSSSGPTRRGA